MHIETWKPIPGMPGHEVSDAGRVRSFLRNPAGTILKPGKTGRGYLMVAPCVNGKNLPRRVHHLVLLAFVGPRPPGMVGCHNNDIPDDNRVANLRWDTPESNVADRERRRYLRPDARGLALTHEQVLNIYRDPRLPRRIIAAEYGISRWSVHDIKHGRTWAAITGAAST